MIIKIKTRKRSSFRQLINYIIHDTERVPDSRIILHNLTDGSVDDWVGWFKYNETFREKKRKNSVILTHEILSFHPKDTPHLSVEKLEAIAREYIERRNPSGIYLGAIHLAKDHYHIHFCVSGVEYHSGQAMRLSKGEMKELKLGLQQHQEHYYPELEYSSPSHGRSKNLQLTDKEYYRKKQTGQLTTREKIHLLVHSSFDEAKDIDDFLGDLAEHGLEPYFRNGVLKGVKFEQRRYRFSTLGVQIKKLEKGKEK